MKYALGLLGLILLSGCSWFDAVGEHFPVIGERCEYWQCFTAYGQQRSEEIKQARQQQAQGSASGIPANAKPVNQPGDVPGGAATTPPPATTQAPQSQVKFIDPTTLGPVDLSQPPPAPTR